MNIKYKRLSDGECDNFRRLPVSFRDMVREIHEAGFNITKDKVEEALKPIRKLVEYFSSEEYSAPVTSTSLEGYIEERDDCIKAIKETLKMFDGDK